VAGPGDDRPPPVERDIGDILWFLDPSANMRNRAVHVEPAWELLDVWVRRDGKFLNAVLGPTSFLCTSRSPPKLLPAKKQG